MRNFKFIVRAFLGAAALVIALFARTLLGF